MYSFCDNYTTVRARKKCSCCMGQLVKHRLGISRHRVDSAAGNVPSVATRTDTAKHIYNLIHSYIEQYIYIYVFAAQSGWSSVNLTWNICVTSKMLAPVIPSPVCSWLCYHQGPALNAQKNNYGANHNNAATQIATCMQVVRCPNTLPAIYIHNFLIRHARCVDGKLIIDDGGETLSLSSSLNIPQSHNS